jgi:5S rRNA maturation endonuclease (ribonuclease M5)
LTSTQQGGRLEAIELLLDDLRKRGPGVAVIVEGPRDVEALVALGVPQPIVKINTGVTLVVFCEMVAREYDSFLILTDMDRTGIQLAKRLEELLRWTGADVDVSTRRRLFKLLPYQIHEVESLESHVQRLRHEAGLDKRPLGAGKASQRPPR